MNPEHAAAGQRRARYIAHRRAGLLPVDAAREAGVSPDPAATARYERWYKATIRGERFLAHDPRAIRA